MKAYLDNLATTPLDPRVLDAMLPVLEGPPGNPHSRVHGFGAGAARLLDEARAGVAAAAGAKTGELYFFPSATTANNLAVIGVAKARAGKGRHLIVSAVEHPSVLEPARALKNRGFEVDEVPVGPGGMVEPAVIADHLRPDTVLVSLMAVNNEVGSVQPVGAVADLISGHGALLHCDAAQAAGKIGLQATRQADLVTLSSHKVYGPSGAAALVIRSRRQVTPVPLIFGGAQENGLWPGTANTAALVGFARALTLAESELAADGERIGHLMRTLEDGLFEAFPGTRRNGDPANAVPQCLSLRFEGVKGETLLSTLTANGIGASFGSACAAGDDSPSHVLTALGLDAEDARRTLRFGIGRFTTREEIDYTLDVARKLSVKLKG